ncbi:MAG: hypothetical protein J0I84_00965 [Terrimonas sp.]|nr:hypothetical protein [Terrimonas sp.]OJY88654.1 MAG: hypothetical protein BGP13_17245 [Sphingobacteriales bacterium 40-81]
MITQEKLKIYKKYDGNIDSWARSGRKKEKTIMEDKDWGMIDGLIQDLKLADRGLAAEVYINDIYKRMNENCDSAETVEEIKAMLYSERNAPQPANFFSRIFNLYKSL